MQVFFCRRRICFAWLRIMPAQRVCSQPLSGPRNHAPDELLRSAWCIGIACTLMQRLIRPAVQNCLGAFQLGLCGRFLRCMQPAPPASVVAQWLRDMDGRMARVVRRMIGWQHLGGWARCIMPIRHSQPSWRRVLAAHHGCAGSRGVVQPQGWCSFRLFAWCRPARPLWLAHFAYLLFPFCFDTRQTA